MHHHHRPQRSRQDSLHETARPHRLPRPSRILRTRCVGRGPSMRLDQIHRKNRIDIQRAEMRVGVVCIYKILLAVIDWIGVGLLKFLGACDWQKVKLWLWMTSPARSICQPFDTMSAYDDILGWHIDLLSWLTPQKHYISQSFQYNSTRMSSRSTIMV